MTTDKLLAYIHCIETIKECGRGKVLESLDDDWWPGRVYRELNVSCSDEIREKDVMAKLAELELLQPDEVPHVPFSAHIGNMLKYQLANKTEDEVRETLFAVLKVMLAENGRGVIQAEEVQRVLLENGLWPTD